MELSFLERIKYTSSVPRDYVGRSSKGLKTYMSISTRNSPKSKQKANFATTDVCLQSFVKILDDLKDVPYQGYKRKE